MTPKHICRGVSPLLKQQHTQGCLVILLVSNHGWLSSRCLAPQWLLVMTSQSAASKRTPQGPRTIEALGQWPEFYAKACWDSEMGQRLVGLVRGGVYMHSDYSGWDSQKEGFRVVWPQLEQLSGVQIPAVVGLRACDWEQLPHFVYY